MSPGKARHILVKRRNWIAAKLEGADPLDFWRDRAEAAALDVVIAMLPLPSVEPAAVEVARKRSLEHVRQIQRERAERCSCERCPVHGRKAAAE